MIDEIFAKVADYHMDHRGHIGFVVGAVAAVLSIRSGLDAAMAGFIFEMLFGGDNPAVDQLKFVADLSGAPSGLLIAGGVIADVVIHKSRVADKERQRNEEQISRDDNGPQPPAP